MSDLIFVVGRQRSGTTVFRDLLLRHGALNCDEILHGDLSRPHRFYAYVQSRAEAAPELIHPEHHPSLFWDFIAELRAEASGRKLAIDVKYFGLNFIPQRDNVANEQPFLIGFMSNQNANVVHIIRRNKLRIYVSEELARLTGRWSAEKHHQLVTDKPRVHVDTHDALDRVRVMIAQDQSVTGWLDRIETCDRVFYDDMFDDAGLFTPQVQDIAASVLGQAGDYSKPGNLKMNPEGLPDLISNYDEVARAFRDTEHAWMLSDMH